MPWGPVMSQSHIPRGEEVTKDTENNSVCQIIDGGVEEIAFCHHREDQSSDSHVKSLEL